LYLKIYCMGKWISLGKGGSDFGLSQWWLLMKREILCGPLEVINFSIGPLCDLGNHVFIPLIWGKYTKFFFPYFVCCSQESIGSSSEASERDTKVPRVDPDQTPWEQDFNTMFSYMAVCVSAYFDGNMETYHVKKPWKNAYWLEVSARIQSHACVTIEKWHFKESAIRRRRVPQRVHYQCLYSELTIVFFTYTSCPRDNPKSAILAT
jgi:hypothetical protein